MESCNLANKIGIPKQVEESVFDLADDHIFESEKTSPLLDVGDVFSDSNLQPSALSKLRFFNLFGYRILVLIALLILVCTGCYRMPEEGQVSVVPVTNNPSMTRSKGGWVPGVAY